MESGRLEEHGARAVDSISVFFPCFNDATTIASMVGSAVGVLDAENLAGDVTVVDDGSTDASAAVLTELAQHEPRLRIVTHPTNRGYGAALQSGFEAATGEWIFYTDGDGQYDPGELRVLLAEACDDVDVVQGYKLSRSDNVVRRLIGRLYHHTVALMFGLRVRDTDCDFRLIRRSVFENVSIGSNSGVICVELVHALQQAGARFVEVGVHHYARVSGRSTFFRPANVLKTLVDLVGLWLRVVVRGRTRRPRPTKIGARAGIVGAAAVLFALVFATALRTPLDRADEAWFLWVAVRANTGARLYHDVYYVSTPLAMWLMQGAVHLFGPHIWVERALVSASFTGSVILLWLIGERLGVSRRARLLVCGAVLLFGAPVAHFVSAYSTLAVALCLAALWATLGTVAAVAESRRATRPIIVTGTLCALTVATKPNIGLVALGAASVALLAARRIDGGRARSALRDAGTLGAAFGATLLVVAVPFLVNGTMPALVSDVFTGKGSVYFAVEGGVLRGLSQSLGLLLHPGARWQADIQRLEVLVPFVALLLLALTVVRCRRRWTGARVAVVCFAIVGVVGAAPDFGAQHLTETLPLLLALPAFGYVITRPAPVIHRARWRSVVAACAAVALMAGVVGVASWARRPRAFPDNRLVAERAGPVAGVVTTQSLATQTQADLAELRRDTGGTVYLDFLSASYYYLVGHLRDPTAFDYPERSDLGSGGERGLIEALRRRHVRWVCVGNRPLGPNRAIRPLAVNRFVRTHFHFVERLHVCDLYTVPTRAAVLTAAASKASPRPDPTRRGS